MGFIEGAIASSGTALPLQRLIEATMRGNAESQAQAQVKDVAGKQAEAKSKLQITMTADPDDPGNPNIHIKNAKADLLNQTQGDDLKQAYVKPKQNVEDAIAKMNATPPPAGQFERDALTSVGYPPERTDLTGADLNTYGRDYRAQRDLGEPIIKAALKAAIMRTGVWNEDKIAEELDRNASLKNSAAFRAAALPAMQEQDRQGRENRSEASLLQTAAHQKRLEEDSQRRLDDAERTRAQTRKQQVNQGIDYSLIEPGEGNANWHKTFDDANDSGVPATPEDYARIDRKAAQDVAKLYNDFFIAKKDVYQLGHFPTFEAATSAYGHSFASKQEEARARNAWAAAHEYDQQQDQKRQLQNEATTARLELTRERLANGTQTKLDDSAVKLFGVDEILSMDPSKVKNLDEAIKRKAALLRSEIQSEADKMKGFQTRKLDAENRAHTSGGHAETANLNAEMAISNRKVIEAQRGLEKINAWRKQPAPPPASSHLKAVNGKTVYVP